MGGTHFLSEAVFADAVTLDAATAYAYAISSRERARLRESVLHDRAAACRSNAGAADKPKRNPRGVSLLSRRPTSKALRLLTRWRRPAAIVRAYRMSVARTARVKGA
jgi:hypothetical protein